MSLPIEVHSLTTLLFSFSILSIVLTFDRERGALRAIGAIFFVPFIMILIWKTLYTSIPFYPMIMITDFGFFLAMLIWNILSRRQSGISISYATSLLLPILLVALVPLEENYLFLPYLPLITLVLMLGNLILLRLFHRENKKFFVGVLCFAVGLELSQLGILDSEIEFLIFRLIGFLSFTLYFFLDIRNQFLKEIQEAEQLKQEVERDIHKVARKRVAEIELANKVLLDRSNTDTLTNALNKRALIAKIKRMASESSREKPFSMLMFDIDHFKGINDKLGHAVGDQCITQLAKIARESIRDVDILGRYGGDEFIILLPNAHIDQAQNIAERFRRKVDTETKPHFSISIGIACAPMDGNTYEEMIAAADEGLYASKEKGRNAVSYRDSF